MSGNFSTLRIRNQASSITEEPGPGRRVSTLVFQGSPIITLYSTLLPSTDSAIPHFKALHHDPATFLAATPYLEGLGH
jgi:hypothetical protein